MCLWVMPLAFSERRHGLQPNVLTTMHPKACKLPEVLKQPLIVCSNCHSRCAVVFQGIGSSGRVFRLGVRRFALQSPDG